MPRECCADGLKAAKLYRNPRESQHWVVSLNGCWMRFPAKIGGWGERRGLINLRGQRLQKVPLWLAFNTGLLEYLQKRNLGRAA